MAGGRVLDMTRGRPPSEVLDALAGLERAPPLHIDGLDLRNYGAPLGLPSARRLGGELLDAPQDATLVGPNSSMVLVHQVVTAAFFAGWAGQKPWRERGARPKVLFPVPGYDRHAKLLETFGLELVAVPMEADGMAEPGFAALAEDPAVVGLVCVPRHSNPGGEIWSRAKLDRVFEACERRGDLLVLCDHAYAIHDLYEAPAPFSIYEAAGQRGALDALALFGSTSKLGYAGSGLSFLACSPDALRAFEPVMAGMTLGADKLAQGRHLAFFGDSQGLRQSFQAKAAPLLRHRFDLVQERLARLDSAQGFSVSRPLGGYFHSLWVPDGCASRAVGLAAERGVAMTPAGASYPGATDPDDRHLRIACTSPQLEDLPAALDAIADAALAAAG